MSNATAPLIKGYLPVRLRFPSSQKTGSSKDSDAATATDKTYFYVREHRGKQQQQGDSDSNFNKPTKPGTTLFVANAPVIPGISTKLLLKSLFGRFASVARVTVVQNPRGNEEAKAFTLHHVHDIFRQYQGQQQAIKPN